MNPDLLNLRLPLGEIPALPDPVRSFEENDRWHLENHRFRLLRGEDTRSFLPSDERFTMEDWPLDPEAPDEG